MIDGRLEIALPLSFHKIEPTEANIPESFTSIDVSKSYHNACLVHEIDLYLCN